MRFENKVAVVTGSGGGIGEGYARALAREGAAVVVAEIAVSAVAKGVGAVSQAYEDGVSMGGELAAVPVTGRTNQIRIHLWHLGTPVVGDPTYLPDGERGERQTLTPGNDPLQLCAWKLAFEHPLKKERVSFEDERPDWAQL